jgi:hypothetical protein
MDPIPILFFYESAHFSNHYHVSHSKLILQQNMITSLIKVWELQVMAKPRMPALDRNGPTATPRASMVSKIPQRQRKKQRSPF